MVVQGLAASGRHLLPLSEIDGRIELAGDLVLSVSLGPHDPLDLGGALTCPDHQHPVVAPLVQPRHQRRAREERLARAGCAHQEHALRDAAAELLELLRFLEELDDLLELFLRFVNAGDVLERHFLLRARRQFRFALAERQRLVAAALHLAHEEHPEADHDEEGRPVIKE